MPKKSRITTVLNCEATTPNPSDVRRAIERDESVKLVVASLMLGKEYAATRFIVYGGFLAKLRRSYESGDGEAFLYMLRTYFCAAVRFVPQIPKDDKAEKICQQISSLIALYGVKSVGKHILARMIG